MKSSFINRLLQLVRAKLSDRAELKKTLANIVWLVSENLIRLVIGTIVGVWLARYLGPDEFGIYNYALAFVSLFAPVVTLGLDNIVIRDLVKGGSKESDLVGTTFVLKLLAGLVTCGVIMLSIFYIKPNDQTTQWVVLIMAGTVIFYAFDAITFWFQSKVKSKFVVYAKSGTFLLTSAIRAYLLFTQASFWAFVWVALFELMFSSIALVIVYQYSKQSVLHWRMNWALAKSLMKTSWPLIFSGLAIIIYMKIDQIMIGNMLGNAEVGIYSVAVRLGEVWYFIPMAIAGSVFPAIVAARNIDFKLYINRLQLFYDLMAWLAILIAIPVTILSPYIINFLYGAAYQAAAPVLSVYIWAGVAVFLGVATEQYLLTENLTRISLMRTIFGTITNVVLNLYLIPKYGIIGSAWATLISYTVSTFSMLFFKQARINFLLSIKSFNLFRVLKQLKSLKTL